MGDRRGRNAEESSIDTVLENFRSLYNKIQALDNDDPRRDVYLGSINRYAPSFGLGGAIEADPQANASLDDLLNTYTSEDIVEGYAAGAMEPVFEQRSHLPPFLRTGHGTVHLICPETAARHISVEDYRDTLSRSLNELLQDTPYSIDVVTDTVPFTAADWNILDKLHKGGEVAPQEATEFLRSHSDIYANSAGVPLFLVDKGRRRQDVGTNELIGHAYSENFGLVELLDNTQTNKSTMVHEAGHLFFDLPHHFYRKGVMSYNPQSGGDLSFHRRSQQLVNRLLEASYDITQSSFWDGERQKTTKLRYHYRLANVPAKDNKDDFFHNLSVYLHDKCGFNMSEWRAESHQIVPIEEGQRPRYGDTAFYGHTILPLRLTLTVDNSIESLAIEITEI